MQISDKIYTFTHFQDNELPPRGERGGRISRSRALFCGFRHPSILTIFPPFIPFTSKPNQHEKTIP